MKKITFLILEVGKSHGSPNFLLLVMFLILVYVLLELMQRVFAYTHYHFMQKIDNIIIVIKFCISSKEVFICELN